MILAVSGVAALPSLLRPGGRPQGGEPRDRTRSLVVREATDSVEPLESQSSRAVVEGGSTQGPCEVVGVYDCSFLITKLVSCCFLSGGVGDCPDPAAVFEEEWLWCGRIIRWRGTSVHRVHRRYVVNRSPLLHSVKFFLHCARPSFNFDSVSGFGQRDSLRDRLLT